MTKIFTLSATLIALLCSAQVFAQPANDSACNAELITVDDGPVTGDNTDATADTDEVIPPAVNGGQACVLSWCDGLPAENSVWYMFVAPANGAVVVTTCLEGTTIDTQLALWSVDDCADYSTFTFVAANDDMPNDCELGDQFASTFSADGLTPGATYYIQVDGFDGLFGLFEIEVTTGVPMTRINFVHNSGDAILNVVDIRMNGELVADDLSFQTCTGYIDVAAGNGITISICEEGSTDDSNAWAFITQDISAVTDYVMITHGIYSKSGYDPITPLTIAVYENALITPSGPDDHDLLFFHGSTDAPTIDIEVIDLGGITLVNDLMTGTYNSAGYVQVGQENYSLDITDADGEPLGISVCAPLGLFGGNIALTIVASGFLDPAANSDGAPLGFFIVNHFDGLFIELALGDCPIPANDVACTASNITVNAPPLLTTNLFASVDEGEVTPPNLNLNDPEADCLNAWCDGVLNGTVWFTFTAPLSGSVIINTCYETSFDSQIAVYSVTDCGDYSTYEYIAANDDAEGGCQDGDTYASTLIVQDLTAGTVYYIQLDGWEGTTGETEISVTDLVDISEFQLAGVIVYPNPANNELNLSGIKQRVKASLLDVTGKMVWCQTISSNITVDVAQLAQGVYLLQMEQDGMREVRKIVIE